MPVNRRAFGPAVVVVLLAGMTPAIHAASELQERTRLAYDAYAREAEARFVARAEGPAPAAGQVPPVRIGPAHEDGIIGVSGGLVHHWFGSMFMPGVSLRRVLDVATRYGSYDAIYREIIASRLIDRDGDTYRVAMRLKEGEAGVSAVLDVRSTIQHREPTDTSAYSISSADEIREVQHAGSRDERLLPAGKDSGYLWRANVFTWFVEVDGGVYMEVETLGLSRRFPPLLGWLIEPIARRLGRKSVVQSLEQFRTAVATPEAGEAGPADAGTWVSPQIDPESEPAPVAVHRRRDERLEEHAAVLLDDPA